MREYGAFYLPGDNQTSKNAECYKWYNYPGMLKNTDVEMHFHAQQITRDKWNNNITNRANNRCSEKSYHKMALINFFSCLQNIAVVAVALKSICNG